MDLERDVAQDVQIAEGQVEVLDRGSLLCAGRLRLDRHGRRGSFLGGSRRNTVQSTALLRTLALLDLRFPALQGDCPHDGGRFALPKDGQARTGEGGDGFRFCRTARGNPSPS